MYTTVKLIDSQMVTGTNYLPFGIQSNEILAMIFSIKLANSTAGIGAGTPCTIAIQTTWNEGASWETLTYDWEAVIGDGIYRGKPTGVTPRLGPICRLVFTVPAGESTVLTVWKPSMDVKDPYNFMSNELNVSASTGYNLNGIPVAAEVDTATPANNQPLPVEIYAGQGEGPIAGTITGNAQHTQTTDQKAMRSVGVMLGYDGVGHRELLVGLDGKLKVATDNLTPQLKVTHDYAVPVTTLAWTELVASTAVDYKMLDIFDSSGELMVLGVGASGSEIEFAYVFPGGCQIPATITAGSRIAIKAVSANATVGYFAANFY